MVRKNLGGQPTTEGTDRLMFGETRVIFQTEREANAQCGQRGRPHRLLSQGRRCAMKGDWKRTAAKIEGPAREAADCSSSGLVVDRIRTRLESCRTPRSSDCTHVHLRGADPNASLAWYVDKFGVPSANEGSLDGINYVASGCSRRGEATPSAGHAIDHIGFRPLNVDNARDAQVEERQGDDEPRRSRFRAVVIDAARIHRGN